MVLLLVLGAAPGGRQQLLGAFFRTFQHARSDLHLWQRKVVKLED